MKRNKLPFVDQEESPEKPAPWRGSALKDSGGRQDFGTGSVRDLGDGKGAYELLQEAAIHAAAMQLERGSQKYGFRNWERGQPVSRYIQSCRRHLGYYMMGLRDEPHLSAALWNLMCAISTLTWVRIGKLPAELDDLPAALSTDEQEKLLVELKKL